MRHSILAILVLMIMRPIHGYIDLFLNSNETSSILGYTGSFFYLFNGELRLNSIKHRLEIPFERNFVELTWKTSSPKIQVDYKISQIKPLPPPLTAPIFKMSINSTGNVPNSLSTFRLEFLCNHHDANHTSSYIVDYVDLTLEYYFALNDKKQSLSSALTDFQLLAMPAINFTMSYRKFCTDSVLISPVSKDRSLSSPNNRRSSGSSSSSSSSSSFILAYVIIAILVASVILIGLAYVYYTALNKKRRRELLRTSTHNLEAAAAAVAGSKSKYESFPGVRQPTKIYYEQQQQPLTVRSHPRPAFVKSSSASSGVAVVAAAASQARRVGSRPSTHRQPLDANNSSSNIYETVPDQSIVSQQPTATTTTIEAIATKSNGVGGGYKSLNVTANTIVSNYNNASVVTTATTATAITGGSGWTRRLNPGQVEKCKKFASDQIDLGSVIMEGTYSRIYEATITFSRDSIYTNDDQDDDNETEGTMDNDEDDEAATITSKSASSSKVVRVLVKSVNERATREQTERMLIESAMLRGLKHKNINAIMGISICDDVSMSIFPASQLGNLKTFLIEHRPNKRRLSKSNSDESTDQVVALTLQDILFMILQLLKGVNFLHQKHIIHRDIAARNCWLDKGLKLKLADFALSRDMFPNDYHCVADNENRPVHWMSLETLRSNVYTSRSDIWTLGVAIWECFAFGAQPYDQVDPFEFADYLAEDEAQNRLVNPLPANCPQQVYEVVERCWRSNPSDRPSLKELFNSFHQFYNSLKTYV